MFTYHYYIIALSQILSTLQIISHMVRHKPTKLDSDNQHCYKKYIRIYIICIIYVYILSYVVLSVIIHNIYINDCCQFKERIKYILK